MKKLFAFFVTLVFCVSVFAQNETPLESLLHRFEELKNSPLSLDDVLKENFTQNEQQLLLAHLGKENVFPAFNRTSLLPEMFYAQNIRGDSDSFGSLEGTPPYDNFNVINANGLNIYADDFDNNGRLFGINYSTNSLVNINPVSGNFFEIGQLTGYAPGHQIPSGLSFNHNNNTMYALSTNGANSHLYTIDLETAQLTHIGSGTGNDTGIWIEIDNDGNAWMADIDDNLLYSVDLSTGVSTSIGPLGIDIDFAQDVSYDHETNELFMAAYLGGGTGGIYSVDTTTGMATLIGETDGINVELGGFSVPPAIGGVEDLIAKKISTYPNPVQHTLYFDIAVGVELKTAHLYTVLGSNTGISYDNGSMDVSSLAQGIYVLVIETDEGPFSVRMVKE